MALVENNEIFCNTHLLPVIGRLRAFVERRRLVYHQFAEYFPPSCIDPFTKRDHILGVGFLLLLVI